MASWTGEWSSIDITTLQRSFTEVMCCQNCERLHIYTSTPSIALLVENDHNRIHDTGFCTSKN